MTKPRVNLNATDNALYRCRNISTVDKILAYKIFLRPKLIFEWYNNCNGKLKAIERKALKRIFDASRHYGGITKQYSDLDVTGYLRLQELRWKRATNLNINQLRLNIIHITYGVIASQCTMTEIKSLLEGCDRLLGLNLTSVGGTIINDHNCDVLLPKQVFNEEPLFQYPLADSKKFYTIIMVDPDAPPQAEGEFYLHMLKSNIPGLALKAKESSKTVGIDYRGYKNPAPPRGTGPHRYLILLYEQADGNNFLPTVPTTRYRFGLASWLQGKNLCGPVAGIQFRCEF